jgi:hypothetical protein
VIFSTPSPLRLLAILALLAATAHPTLCAQRPSPPPNILFILIDDMPWFGTPVRMSADLPESAMAFRHMPHVEKLAARA